MPLSYRGEEENTRPGRSLRKKQSDEIVALERAARKSSQPVMDEIIRYASRIDESSTSDFQPTYSGSYYEHDWIFEYLGSFYEEELITDVLHRVKGGKEATVYCCAAHPDTGLSLLAAKVYRPRMFRSLRNDTRYRQGRSLLDGRGRVIHDRSLLKAVRAKTRIGEEAEHTSWLDHEHTTLQKLFSAGVDVPRPVALGHNTILMEFAGSEFQAAPSLHETTLPDGEARDLFERILENIRRMLSSRIIHGDLSSYNILYWEKKPYLIDFPQAVDPLSNPEAYAIFARDVLRVCQYFARYGLPGQPHRLARQLWQEAGWQAAVPPGAMDQTSL